jgi:hypothetical protein
VDTSAGYWDLVTNDTLPAALFTADVGTEAQVPVSVGYDGFVRRMDTEDMDDVLANGTGGVAINDRLLSRPMLMGEAFRKKRGRTVRVKGTTTTTRTPTVKLVYDGTAGTAHTLSMESGGPVSVRAKVNGRGKELQVDITSAGAGTKISALEIGAELLRERP